MSDNGIYKQLETVHAKLATLRDSCTAISQASEGGTDEFCPGPSWFEGAAEILREARGTTGTLLCDYEDELKEAPNTDLETGTQGLQTDQGPIRPTR